MGPTTANIWNVYFPFHCYFFRAFCLAVELIHYVYLFAICKQFVAYQQRLNDDKNKNVLDYFRYYLSVIKYVYRVRRCTKGKIKRIRYIFFTNLIYIFIAAVLKFLILFAYSLLIMSGYICNLHFRKKISITFGSIFRPCIWQIKNIVNWVFELQWKNFQYLLQIVTDLSTFRCSPNIYVSPDLEL